MKIRYFSLILGLISLLCIAAPSPEATQKSQPVSPQTTILMFDIDDVLLIKPEGTVKNAVWNNLWTIVTSPRLAWKLYGLKRTGAAAMEYIRVCKQEGNEKLATMIENIALSKIPMPGMTEFIQKLKRQGYRLDIASNMAREDFDFYAKKYPELFSSFTGIKVIDYKENKPAKKPNPEYFKQYLQDFPSSKKRLFFDDKKENVLAAQSCGIDAIHVKNAQQAQRDFFQKGQESIKRQRQTKMQPVFVQK